MGLLKESFALERHCKGLEGYVDTDSVSKLLTSANVRSVGSPGSRETEVYIL